MTNREKYEQEMFELQLANAKRVDACINRGGNPQGLHILLNPEYQAILMLARKLTEAKINHSLVRWHDGYKIVVWTRDNNSRLAVIREDYSVVNLGWVPGALRVDVAEPLDCGCYNASGAYDLVVRVWGLHDAATSLKKHKSKEDQK